MSNLVIFNLQVKDATAKQTSLSNPLVVGEFEADANSAGPLKAGVYFTDDLLVKSDSNNYVRTMVFESVLDAADVFLTSSKIYKAIVKLFGQAVSPQKVFVGQARTADTDRSATLNAISAEQDDFYYILDVDADDVDADIIDDWASANEKYFRYLTNNSGVKAATSTDIAATLKAKGTNSTEVIFTNEVDADGDLVRHDAAITGFVSALRPGLYTEKFLKLIGCKAVDSKTYPVGTKLTPTDITNILNKNANIYAESNVGPIYREGTAASGRFEDVQRYSKYLKQQIVNAVSLVLANPPNGNKVPYTDGGVSLIRGAIAQILQFEIGLGRLTPFVTTDIDGIDTLVPYEINVTPVVDVPINERNARQYNNKITVKVRYSSAIHNVEIDGDMYV